MLLSKVKELSILKKKQKKLFLKIIVRNSNVKNFSNVFVLNSKNSWNFFPFIHSWFLWFFINFWKLAIMTVNGWCNDNNNNNNNNVKVTTKILFNKSKKSDQYIDRKQPPITIIIDVTSFFLSLLLLEHNMFSVQRTI